MTSVCDFRHVTKRFGDAFALRDVSFSVKPGQVVALLGENGAGKTTAIRILLGLLNADDGEARVLQLNSRKFGDEIRRRIGYVPDRPALYDWMTVDEAGWFAAGFCPLGTFERFLQLARKFDLPGNRPIKALSKGMQAKVSLSLALAHEPDLLILDEPTSGLDPLVRREFLESMVDIAATGRTVFLSSHQIAEVERVADTVLVLRHGRLVLNERLESLKSRVKQVQVTLDAVDTAPPPLPDPAHLLASESFERRWQLLVRDFGDAQQEILRSLPGVLDVQSRTPSLEEIFVACMQDSANATWTIDEPVAMP